jgi:hypothetical protein
MGAAAPVRAAGAPGRRGRVRRRGPREAVAEICRRVDRLPLAIELAAAGCALLSPAEIAERLEAVLSAPGAGDRNGARAGGRCGRRSQRTTSGRKRTTPSALTPLLTKASLS